MVAAELFETTGARGTTHFPRKDLAILFADGLLQIISIHLWSSSEVLLTTFTIPLSFRSLHKYGWLFHPYHS